MQNKNLQRHMGGWLAIALVLVPAPAHPLFRLSQLQTELPPAGRVVIVGERHRHPSSHQLFLDFVRDTATRGERVLVGLEIPSDRQAALDTVLRGERSPEGLAHPIIDCPSYRALLVGLGELVRARGAQVEVRALDAPIDGCGTRDAAMAASVLTAVRSGAFDWVAVLAGNLHALKEVPWAPAAVRAGPRMARLLADAGVPVLSLLQAFEGEGACGEQASFYPAGEPVAALNVLALWAGLNTQPASPGVADRAADGVILWRCNR
jgi:hypothetical protein